MSLETLLEAAQFIEVETDEDGRTRVKAATHLPPYAAQIAVKDEPQPRVVTQPIPGPPTPVPSQDGRSLRAIGSGTRDLHNRLEKNRRAHLKDCFDNLRKQIPNFDDIKASNLSILRNAIRTIQQLTRKEKELEIEMQRLAREKIMSQERISILKMELAAMNIEYDINHFMESNNPENHSSSTATADEEVPATDNTGLSDDDDRNSSSTLSTTSPGNSSANFRSPSFPPTSPVRSPRSLLQTNIRSPYARTPVTNLQSILNMPLLNAGSAGQGQSIALPVSTSGDNSFTVQSPGPSVPMNKSVTQLLQEAIMQRQEQQLAQQKSVTQPANTEVQNPAMNVMTVKLPDPLPLPSPQTPQKHGAKRKHSVSATVSTKPTTSQSPVAIQPLIKTEQTTSTSAPPNVINLNTGGVTLNQLLPSRYPAVAQPAVVNTVDLTSLLKLSGAQVITEAKQQPVIKNEDLQNAVAGTSSAAANVQNAAVTTIVPSTVNAQSVTAANLKPATPQSIQPAVLANTLLGAAVSSQANVVSQPTTPLATPGGMPVQLITTQQLQQLLLQATLQQQLAQQLVAAAGTPPKTVTLAAPVASASPSATVSAVATPTPSEASTATVTPITMPTIPLNQLIQPITDLSAAMSPAVQLAPANLQQTLATAQLNQMVVPQVLKTLGQFPYLQQPTILPIMVTMPSVVTPTTQNASLNTSALSNSSGNKDT